MLTKTVTELQTRVDDLNRVHDERSLAWESEKSALQSERDELAAKANASAAESPALEEEIHRLREELAAYPPLVEELKHNLESARTSENLAKSHLYQLGIRLPN